jgi:N-acetyl-anhydromuramyl-L-alanine amidase AmpD
MARRARRNSRRSSARAAISTRTKVVWLALVGAMTGLGGVLLALDGRHAARVDGLAMPPLMAATSASSQIESIFGTRRPLDMQRWKYVVIHHTGEHYGTEASITRQHVKQGLQGLGHHFLIGNGSGMDDGELFVGKRWQQQQPGAHAVGTRSSELNQQGISICLVGNCDRTAPTRAQMDRLAELVSALCRQLNIPRDRVILHSDAAPVSDPGRRFPEAQLRQRLAGGL